MTSGPASEVNDWRLRLLSMEIMCICQFTCLQQSELKELQSSTVCVGEGERERESCCSAATHKVKCGSVQTDQTPSQFLDTAGAVPLCRARERSAVDTNGI